MKIMKKIVALMAVALLLCSVLPLSVFAADGDETITVTGTTGAMAEDSLSISWDGTNYQVVNYKDNSSTAIRTSDSAHFRVYVGNEFYVQGKDGALMSQVVINCVSSYLINNASNTVDDGWTVSANGTAITYTATSGAASELHISIGKQSRVTSVVITPGTAAGADCDHDSLVCGDTCPECGEYTKEHKYANNCVAECENGCGTANPDYADHVYDGIYDANCNVCSAAREVNFPAADSVLTISEANELGLAMSHDTTTPSKYYVTGVVESIANTTYGNLYIQDDAGNKLYVYGTYDADGTNRFDAMADQPEVGMTITVYGVIGNYNSASQMKNGWITEMIGGCEHEYLCTESADPTCTEDGFKTYVCNLCDDTYTETLSASGHNYVDDVCSVCGTVKPAGYAPITSADQLVSGQYVMVVGTGYAPTYLDGTWVLTGQPAITDGVISADDAAVYLWTLTVDGNSVVITDANGVSIAPKGGNTNGITTGEYAWAWSFEDGAFIFSGVDSDTVYLASNATANSGDNKFRAYKHTTCTGSSYSYKFTLYAASVPEEPECEHEYTYACDQICCKCYELTNPNAVHSVKHVEAVAATCSANGNIEYWYCEYCGAAWADEAQTQVTNLMSVVVPATGEHAYDDDYDADCNVCGDVREVPEKPVEMLYGDANSDGIVDILDEVLLAQYNAGWDVTLDEAAADANGDGIVDILDEVLLAQYNAGWDVVLGPEKIFNDGELENW